MQGAQPLLHRMAEKARFYKFIRCSVLPAQNNIALIAQAFNEQVRIYSSL